MDVAQGMTQWRPPEEGLAGEGHRAFVRSRTALVSRAEVEVVLFAMLLPPPRPLPPPSGPQVPLTPPFSSPYLGFTPAPVAAEPPPFRTRFV